jgi:hypothetical protein
MKSYKYSTKERAERVAKTLGCKGYHEHKEEGEKKYMPCSDMKTFKSKTKKESKGKEQEVTELIDDDGTWSSDMTPIMDPASSGTINNPTTTDKIVSMTRIPRDPLLRGWYGFYRESTLAEEDMESAFGYDDTKFMDYKETVDYFEKKLGLDKDAAIERAVQQGKKPNLQKRAPKDIKNKKNFIDRLILKEKDIDESENLEEDVLVDKEGNSTTEILDQMSLIKRNITALKKLAKKQNISTKQLIDMLNNEF